MSRIIGIDFGTTNTVAAYVDERGKIQLIEDHNGDVLMPSIVAKQGDCLLVGNEAKKNAISFRKKEAVKEIKREIGKGKRIRFAGVDYEASDIAAIILGKVKGNAEIYFGEEVTEAVITVPAEFSDGQRKEIMEAAAKAGLQVKKILNEPTAALLAYTNEKIANGTYLCYDFGGGTFDVSIARVTSSGVEVLAVGGDRTLGGKDIDALLLEQAKNDIRVNYGRTLTDIGEYHLILALEQVKIRLSKTMSEYISFPTLDTTSGVVPYHKTISRVALNQLIRPIIDRTIRIVSDTLDSKNLTTQSIDYVLLVGGSSNLQLVKDRLAEMFGSNKLIVTDNMDKYVAMGAAIEAANQNGTMGVTRAKIKRDVCPFNLGLKVYRDGSSDVFDPIVTKNVPYGETHSEKYNTAFDNQNTMLLEIYQGESHRASANEHITDLEIKGIPEGPAGREWVRVSFTYDENGIIEIKATILSTGLEVVHKHNYGYKKSRRVNTRAVDSNLIDTETRLQAQRAMKALENDGLFDLADDIEECTKYEKIDELDELLACLRK